MSANLNAIPLFDSLPQGQLDALSHQAVTRALPKNAVVVNEGDETDSLYIILSGHVKFYVNDEEGKEFVLGNAGPGDYFGEIVMDGGRRSASVMALEPCVFCIIQKSEMKEFVASNPDIALHIIQTLSRRTRVLTQKVKSLALLDVYGRVSRLLLELAREVEGALVITEKLTQQDMANRVGASREMISRILKDLTTGGYIEQRGPHIIVRRKPPRHW